MNSPIGVAAVALVLLSILLVVLFVFGFVRFLRREELQPFSWDLDYQRPPALFVTWLRKPDRELWDGLWSSIGMSFVLLAAIPAAMMFGLESAYREGFFLATYVPGIEWLGGFSLGVILSFAILQLTLRDCERGLGAYISVARDLVKKSDVSKQLAESFSSVRPPATNSLAIYLHIFLWLVASLATVFLAWLGIRWLVNLFAV